MSSWIIDNGTLLLRRGDGTCFRPFAAELFKQADKEYFTHLGVRYAPLSETNLRFSRLTAPVSIEFEFKDSITLNLSCFLNDSRYLVSVYDDTFNDYIIYEDTWKYTGPIVDSINSILLNNGISPTNISYRQYVFLRKEFNRNGIDILDTIESKLQVISEPAGDFEKPDGLCAELYPYQRGGVNWLSFMVNQKCGCILADEMGLGKTLQIISLMGAVKESLPEAHFLVVCPVSLLENWRREIARFYPALKTNIHYGGNRTGDYRELLKYDVNIMSYSGTITDSGLLTMIQWNLLVIDEAQNIKNPKAKRTLAIKQIKCDVPVAVTGTPFENHMTDVWSIVDFIIPGFLGSLNQFQISFPDDVDSAVSLEKVISPLILRRRVSEVAKDLPERVDIPQPVIMGMDEAFLYDKNRQSAEEARAALMSMQLETIQKLRTFCTHPCVYDSNYAAEDPASISMKYTRLCEILEEIFASGEKVVIFTSFKRMIEVMCADIKERFKVYTDFIDGSIAAEERQVTVDAFSKVNGAGALILNPKAAGVGLNITCANHAIHYNLEWNPAVEDQASARIYRRGQEKTVFVHRLYYVDTIEEIINERIQSKRLLSDNAIIGNRGENTEREYLIKALSVSPYNKSHSYDPLQRAIVQSLKP